MSGKRFSQELEIASISWSRARAIFAISGSPHISDAEVLSFSTFSIIPDTCFLVDNFSDSTFLLVGCKPLLPFLFNSNLILFMSFGKMRLFAESSCVSKPSEFSMKVGNIPFSLFSSLIDLVSVKMVRGKRKRKLRRSFIATRLLINDNDTFKGTFICFFLSKSWFWISTVCGASIQT